VDEDRARLHFEERHGVDDALLRRVLRRGLSRGGDFSEVFLQHRVSHQVAYEDGRVNRTRVEVDLGAGVRVLKGDQTGYAFTEELLPESLLAAADTASTIASGAPGAAAKGFSSVEIPSLYDGGPVWAEVDAGSRIAIAERVGERILSADPRIGKASVHLGDEDEVFLVANSEGLAVGDSRPMTHLWASCVAEHGGRVESNSSSRSRREGIGFYRDPVLEEIARETAERTLALFDAVAPPAGEMPVVLAPASSGILLHEAMGHGFEADFNRKGASIFADMMGRRVAPDVVSIVDTALVPGARGALNVDDEGAPGRETVLVEGGILASYLHDRISAAHYGVAPTGNGRREDFRWPPLPRMRVTLMRDGPHDPEEIVRSVDRGLYAVDFSNGEVAIGAGDYSFYVKTGYLIEGGRLTAPVKDVNLIGNGPDSLSKVVMVGDDARIDEGAWTCGKDGQSVPVGLGLPTVKVSSITVGGVE